MKVVIAGGSGFIGKKLIDECLKLGYEVVLLSRKDRTDHPHHSSLKTEVWDAERLGTWVLHLDGADAIINLTGEPIAAKRWTREQKKEITNSRIHSTRVIARAIQKAKQKPKVWINGSAVGYYGNVPDKDVTEASPRGVGFLAVTCQEWEQETRSTAESGVRVVLLRTGVVLERGGGALAKMEFPFRIFAGGPLGSGRQWFPWIHRDDIVGLILFAIQNQTISGPMNATAPEPVTMSEFCNSLGRTLHRPSWLPAPAFALRLLLGQMSSMLLEGQRAIPEKALKAGYSFQYPQLDAALQEIFSPAKRQS